MRDTYHNSVVRGPLHGTTETRMQCLTIYVVSYVLILQMYSGGWKGLIVVLISAHALFCLPTATTCTTPSRLPTLFSPGSVNGLPTHWKSCMHCSRVLLNHLLFLLFPVTVTSYRITPIPIAYNNSTTTGPNCIIESGTLSCPSGGVLIDGDTGSAELDTSKVFAWDREVNIAFTILPTKVRQVNLFFYNIPSSGIGLPPAELFWSRNNPINPVTPLSHAIVGNQDLSQDDRTLRNVSLVVTTDQSSIPDYRFFHIHFTIPAETSLIDWILLSEVKLCGEAGLCFHWPFQRLQHTPPGMSYVPLRPWLLESLFRWTCLTSNVVYYMASMGCIERNVLH